MVYLDYSATTPVDKEILKSFNEASLNFLGNANSLHKLGNEAAKLIFNATTQIANLLKVKNEEIIYTSGSTEANNLAIKGVCLKYRHRGKHIITSKFEHSSVKETLEYLKTLGFEISYLENDELGIVDVNELRNLIRDDTILVTINHVNSEIGITQPIEEIGQLLKKYKCFFHVDLTQSIGKINVDLQNIDLASFSAHKIYGLKGIGCLIKKEKVSLEPIIHGGKSTTQFRSGTPAHPLIVSLSKALRLGMVDIDKKYQYVKELNNFLIEHLKKYPDVYINSNRKCIPHILNISVLGIKSETFLHALEQDDIFISTKTACNDNHNVSDNVYSLTNDLERAKSSLRISLSYLTTKDELNLFLQAFDKYYHKLKM